MKRSIRKFFGWSCGLVLFQLLALSATAQPQATPAPAPSPASAEAIREMGKKAVACTVGIYCRKDNYASYYGTGAVISPDGYVLTSTTVVPAGAEQIEVIFPDFVNRPGKIVETSEPLETTLIKVEAKDLPFLSLAKELPAVGSRAFTTSNANNVVRLSGRASFSKGHISGIYEVKNQGGESLYAGMAIETTAAVNPGTDGGPIFNEAGQLCAVVSLNVSTARWQGVGVPTKEILARLEAFKTEQVKPGLEPQAPPITDESSQAHARYAAEYAPWFVGIQVERKFPAEILPRTPWEKYLTEVKDWDKKPVPERVQLQAAYFNVARLLEVNQMLRRPAEPVTGIVVSPEGHILTSVFNVADSIAFLAKATGQPHKIEFHGAVDALVKPPEGGFVSVPNPVEKMTVVLADGATREAKLIARHIPLGVALLKVEGEPLPSADLSKLAAPPQLGESVALLGFAGGSGTRFTLNSGMVSATKRNRGWLLQTDAMLNYGNSGGPLVSAEGKILGLATTPIEPTTVQGRLFHGQELNGWAIAPNSGVGMIASAERIRDAIEELKSGKSTLALPGPLLGVGPDPTKAFGLEVIIGQVAPQTPADKAGLKPGDRIIDVNGEEIDDWKDLFVHLEQFKPGDKILLKVGRPGIVKHLKINGQQVSNDAELQTLLKSVQASGKFEGEFVVENTKVVEVVLGERK